MDELALAATLGGESSHSSSIGRTFRFVMSGMSSVSCKSIAVVAVDGGRYVNLFATGGGEATEEPCESAGDVTDAANDGVGEVSVCLNL